MKVKRFSAATMQQGLKLVREELGADAMILSSRKTDGRVEIMAALNYNEQELRTRAPEQARSKSTAELIQLETERHCELQAELEKSRQRIAAVRQSSERPAPEPLWPELAADELKPATQRSPSRQVAPGAPQSMASKDGRMAPARRETDAPQVTAATAMPDALAEMRSEIMMLKELLTQQLQSRGNETQRELEGRLARLGILPELQKKLLEKVAANSDVHTGWRYALALLTRSLKTVEPELIEKGGVFALLGPTGSGKTTTIGKLAARHVLKHGAKGIALVTTDRYRIASHEQLLALGRILGIPVHAVDDKNSLDQVLDGLRGKKLVLIDTAGLNHHESAWSTQLDELKASRHRIQNYLVVSAINQAQVMKSTYHSYKTVGLAGCILTKLDEALTLGEALSLAVLNSLPVAYITDGQKIPDDIHQARANQLVSRMLQLTEEEGGAVRESGLFERELVV